MITSAGEVTFDLYGFLMQATQAKLRKNKVERNQLQGNLKQVRRI